MTAYSDEQDVRDRVVQAALDVVDAHYSYVSIVDLELAVDALRSLHEDRGLRNPGTTREQAPDS
jgi:hypothetical protein